MSEYKVNERTAEFVADWRKRVENQQKKYTLLSIGAFIAAFILCIVLFSWFQSKNYNRIVEQNKNYVQDSAIQEANQVEIQISHAKTLIENLASQYAVLHEHDRDASVQERLRMLRDKNLFDRIAFIAPDGLDTSLEGLADVSDREYYKNGMAGEAGFQALEKSRITGKPTVIFYAPVYSGGQIIGIMAGFYEQDRLDDMFTYQLFNYNPDAYLLLADGTVVANSNDKPLTGNKLTDLSQKKFFGDVDYAEIEAAIADEERTTITFSFRDGGDTQVGVIVQFKQSNWMILSILPYSITGRMVSNANRVGAIMLVALVVIFVLLTVMLMLIFKNQRRRMEQEMDNASRSLDESVMEEQRQLSIIESIAEVYSGLYFVNMETLQYERLKEHESTSSVIADTGDVRDGFGLYVSEFVDDLYKLEVQKFLDVTTFQKRLAKHDTVSIEYQRADKTWRRGTLVPTEKGENGELLSLVFAVQGITAEKKKELKTKLALQEAYEAANLASNAKTNFLSNMSHDIRTPMNAIVGMTAIAGANLDNTEKVADCLKKITASSKHLLGLINEVLDMSKIESGKVDLCEEEFRLSDLIDNLININQPLIKEKNHSLMVKINNLTHEDVVGDSTRLQQVLTNLLSNAIKYTPANGKIEVIVSEKETNKASIGWYEVVFKDNGIGMSEEDQKNLFEPFTRAKDERVNNIQGTGLGMPIARNIVKMMGGDITVESKINEGSTFTVSFALKLQQEEEVRYEEFVDLPVLVVDDDVVACESACTMLNSLSMKSEYVMTGREAVDKTAERHEKNDDYYAVIVDWKMPDMNGIETTRAIRERIGDDIPIIVISAYDWTDIEQEARAAGANAFLSKPLFKSRVVGLFNELLGTGKKPEGGNVKEELKNYDFTGTRVLLVEDNEINREMAIELLGLVGIETETAENGKLGVDKFSESVRGYYDVILMDVQMPVLNGYESARAIRALSHPDARKIPIIAMTANAFASDVRAAYDAGMNGHVSKPIDVLHLVKVLDELIHGGGVEGDSAIM